MLVSVLPALARAGEPTEREVGILSERPRPALRLASKDGDGHSAGVNPPTPLGRGDALNAVSARLVLKPSDGVGLDYRPGLTECQAVLSALRGEILAICAREIAREKLRVVPAFGCSNFNDHLTFSTRSCIARRCREGHPCPLIAEKSGNWESVKNVSFLRVCGQKCRRRKSVPAIVD
jgi:hypothetical protein